ncbi:MAG: prephenate dehydratase domain-containing protein, partial [Pseudomonadota bacterium]
MTSQALDPTLTGRIAYQGEPGANSHVACLEAFPNMEPIAKPAFEDALAAVKAGETRYAMIPLENTLAGRVADVHLLLPEAGLYIIGEHFLRIRFHLMGIADAELGGITDIHSHVHALGQCRNIIRRLGAKG